MSNERTTEGPLKATLGEQLGEKAQHGDPHAREVLEDLGVRPAPGEVGPAVGGAPAGRGAVATGGAPGQVAAGPSVEERARGARSRGSRRRAGGLPPWARWAAGVAAWMLVSGTVRRILGR